MQFALAVHSRKLRTSLTVTLNPLLQTQERRAGARAGIPLESDETEQKRDPGQGSSLGFAGRGPFPG